MEYRDTRKEREEQQPGKHYDRDRDTRMYERRGDYSSRADKAGGPIREFAPSGLPHYSAEPAPPDDVR